MITRISLTISSYNIYGGNQDLKTVFGDVQRFIRCLIISTLSIYY